MPPRLRPTLAPLLVGALLPAALAGQSPIRASAPSTPVAVAAASPVTDRAGAASPADSAARATPAAPAPVRPPRPLARPTMPAPFSGEIRTRGEEAQLAGAEPTAALTYLRARLVARAPLGGHLRLLVGLQGNRTVDGRAHPRGADALDLHEGYLELHGAPAGAPGGATLALRAGRQELALGNERLIGRRNWSNARHSFDGLRLLVAPADRAGWSATALLVTPADRLPAAPVPGDHRIAAAQLVRPLAGSTGASLEGLVVHDRGVRARGRLVTGRTTLAGRARATRLAGLGVDLEGALQRGALHALPTPGTPAGPRQTIDAWMVAARLGTPGTPGTPGGPAGMVVGGGRRLAAAVGVDLLSGDRSAADARDGAFDTLYGSNHGFYGLADIAGGNPAATLRGRGLIDALTTTTLTASRRLAVRVDLHRLAPMRGPGVLGWEGDLAVPLRVLPRATVELGYSAFRAGTAGAALGLGAAGHTRRWSYLQVTAGL